MVLLTISAANNLPPAFARGKFPFSVDVSGTDNVGDVKRKIAEKVPKFYPSRQRLSLKSEKKALFDDIKVQELNVSELDVKDIGPQIGWTTVFFVEYAGPLFIHSLIYHFPDIVYRQHVEHSALQKYTYGFVMLHFLKRELETLFVHRFSHGTMPLFNIFKNSAHYHILSGLFLAYDVYRPAFSSTSPYIRGTFRDDEKYLWIFAGLLAFFELSNFFTHMTLRNIRPAGSQKRAVPFGYGFGLVSCPNYFFEIMAWAVLCVMTGSYACILFTVVATVQMGIWAAKKQRAYKKEFGKEYPRERKAMIPFLF